MKKLMAVFALALASAGCEGVTGPGESVANELRAEKRAWEKQDIRSYAYEYQALCFCANVDPIVIEVRDNVIISATSKVTGQPVPDWQRAGLRTIPQLYDYLIDAAGRADEITADFDKRLHLPTNVRIDFVRYAADDELHIKTSNWAVIGSLY